MQKINVGQRFELNADAQVEAGLSGNPVVLKKGTKLFTGADKKFFYMLNGKCLVIDEREYDVTDGVSVTGLAEWIYQRLSFQFPIDEMLDECADDEETGIAQQREAFNRCIGEALEELGFYDHTGNTL